MTTRLYVDGATGSDNNSGALPTRPLATLRAAIDRIVTSAIGTSYLIEVAAGTYAMPPIPALPGGGQIDIYAPAVTELVSGAAVAGSSTAQVVTGGGLGVNTYRGKTLEILTGAAAGFRRTIRDHTDTTIFVGNFMSGGVAAGDQWRITEPVAVLVPVDGQAPSVGGVAGRRHVSGIPTPLPGVNYVNFFIDNSAGTIDFTGVGTVRFFGCEATNANLLRFLRGSWGCGADIFEAATIGQRVGGLATDQAWWGWGLTAPSALQFFTVDVAELHGLVAGGIYSGSPEPESVYMMGGNLHTTGAWAINGALILNGKASAGQDIPVLIGGGANGWGVRKEGPGARALLLQVDIDVPGFPAIQVFDEAVLEISSNVRIINCTVGVEVYRGGVVQLSLVGFSFVNVPTVAQFEVGNTPQLPTTATFAAVGDFVVDTPSDGSKVQRKA